MIDGDQQWRAVGQSVSYPEGAAMSSHSTKSQLRFGLFAMALWLTAMASAFAQDANEIITLKLIHSDLELIAKALDAVPISESANTVTKVQAQIDAQPGPQWDKYRSAKAVQEWSRTGWKRVTP
jgi:hypothetical protein